LPTEEGRGLILASSVLAIIGGLVGIAGGASMLYLASLGPTAFNETITRAVETYYPFMAANVTRLMPLVYIVLRVLGGLLLATGLVGVAAAAVALTLTSRAVREGNYMLASSYCTSIGVLLIVLGLISIADFFQLVLYVVAGALLLVARGRLRKAAAESLARLSPVNPTA
jgi:hypothetical protein